VGGPTGFHEVMHEFYGRGQVSDDLWVNDEEGGLHEEQDALDDDFLSHLEEGLFHQQAFHCNALLLLQRLMFLEEVVCHC